MPDPTPTQAALEQMKALQIAAADFFAGVQIAQELMAKLEECLSRAAVLASYQVNDSIPTAQADELRTMMGEAQAFYVGWLTNHGDLLAFGKPESVVVEEVPEEVIDDPEA